MASDRRTSSAPYRQFALVADISSLLPAMRTVCPECFVSLKVLWMCELGHESSMRWHPICDQTNCKALIAKTNRVRYCGPNKRIRFGFLWLRKCREPGTHIHQECTRCGWRSVSQPPEQQT